MRASSQTRSWVPLPWCTSKSTIATRSSPCASSACRAPITTLPKKQKPIAVAVSAWCPGGRTAQKAFRTSPAITMSTARTTAPAARRAAASVPGDRKVSASIAAKPRSGEPRRQRREVAGRMRAQDLRVLGQRRLHPHQVGELLGLERRQDRLAAARPARGARAG